MVNSAPYEMRDADWPAAASGRPLTIPLAAGWFPQLPNSSTAALDRSPRAFRHHPLVLTDYDFNIEIQPTRSKPWQPGAGIRGGDSR